MRIIHQNIKKGEVKVMAENLDDLWYLSTLIDAGDLVILLRLAASRRPVLVLVVLCITGPDSSILPDGATVSLTFFPDG